MTIAPLPEPPKRTGFPVAAGIMTIIAGIVNIGIGITALVALSAVSIFTVGVPAVLGAVIGVPLIIIGVVSVIGGVFAIQRRVWGWHSPERFWRCFHPQSASFWGYWQSYSSQLARKSLPKIM